MDSLDVCRIESTAIPAIAQSARLFTFVLAVSVIARGFIEFIKFRNNCKSMLQKRNFKLLTCVLISSGSTLFSSLIWITSGFFKNAAIARTLSEVYTTFDVIISLLLSFVVYIRLYQRLHHVKQINIVPESRTGDIDLTIGTVDRN